VDLGKSRDSSEVLRKTRQARFDWPISEILTPRCAELQFTNHPRGRLRHPVNCTLDPHEVLRRLRDLSLEAGENSVQLKLFDRLL